MKKLIIFDLYNTLIVDQGVESRREYRINAIYSVLETSGLPIRFSQVRDAYDAALAALTKHQQLRFSLSVFDVVRGFCKALHINDGATLKKIYDVWAYAAMQISPALIPGVAEGLGLIKAEGAFLAIISNTSTTPGLALRFMLEDMRIYDYFNDIVFSDEFGFMKPNPMIFARVLQRFGLPPEDALFVGDHEVYDKYGAEQAGIGYLNMNPTLDFVKVARQALQA